MTLHLYRDPFILTSTVRRDSSVSTVYVFKTGVPLPAVVKISLFARTFTQDIMSPPRVSRVLSWGYVNSINITQQTEHRNCKVGNTNRRTWVEYGIVPAVTLSNAQQNTNTHDRHSRHIFVPPSRYDRNTGVQQERLPHDNPRTSSRVLQTSKLTVELCLCLMN